MLQPTFDDLGTSLSEVTFVVVDLETTGGSAKDCEITEIGAVKVRGGEVLGEFQTLVRPTTGIPAFITVLTGISNAMVATAPRIAGALPAFLEFAKGSVLVAHNASFDISFLRAACARTGQPWPDFTVVDTVHLSRQLVGRDESPNHKLSSLARVFAASTTPDHRALHDAAATVDVLHGLIARVGNLGVHTLEELVSYSRNVPTAIRRKRSLADTMPSAPGVYLFKDATGRVLYVGTSVDIRRRTKTYFTVAEKRRRMREMVRLTESLTAIVCQSPLEASVRELRMIAAHKPPFNRRSRAPEKDCWVKLTAETFPRLSIVSTLRSDGADYVGPFSSRRAAADAIAAVHDVVPIRQCTARLSRKAAGSACILAEMGKCGAPCEGRQSADEYSVTAAVARSILSGHSDEVTRLFRDRLATLTRAQRFEEAGVLRDRMDHLLTASARAQRLLPLTRAPELVAARRREVLGGWEVVCMSYGRLAGVCVIPPGQDPMPAINSLRSSAEVVAKPEVGTAAFAQETELIATWLESDGVRLVDINGAWTCPVRGAASAGDFRRGPHPSLQHALRRTGVDGVPRRLDAASPALV
ncbi:MAG: DEDD exonuclease domain-containing protein [Ornithinimicrobium sp.]